MENVYLQMYCICILYFNCFRDSPNESQQVIMCARARALKVYWKAFAPRTWPYWDLTYTLCFWPSRIELRSSQVLIDQQKDVQKSAEMGIQVVLWISFLEIYFWILQGVCGRVDWDDHFCFHCKSNRVCPGGWHTRGLDNIRTLKLPELESYFYLIFRLLISKGH